MPTVTTPPSAPRRSLAARVAGRVDRILVRPVRRALWRGPSDAELALRKRLARHGASMHPRRPTSIWTPWVGAALQTRAMSESALAEVMACGLPAHPDKPKNWDLLVALGLILDRTTPAGAVLEMGATQYSKLLPWLYLYGYRQLEGIDLVYEETIESDPIRYQPMDLTKTSFADASFDAIACLSVIEHGVDLGSFIRESARLLRPGGVLVASTDYWCEPVDTGGQEAYGVPIRILGPADLVVLDEHARAAGLRPIVAAPVGGPMCAEKVVRWERFGLDYTFVTVAFEKPAA